VGPLVSFVIPVRNDTLRLQRCLSSIVSNGYPRALTEIIVVDNDSTDGSAKAARDYGAIVIRASDTSMAALRNRGARAALGGILAFADSDHQIDRNWIETAVGVLAAADVAATGAAPLTQPSPNWVQQQYDGLRSRPAACEDVTWLGSGNLAIKRAVFERVGGFDASLTACEDVDLCNRIGQAGFRIVADPRLRSTHFGDPQTLRALFFGELGRGRDNLRVTFRGPRSLRHFQRALVPAGELWCLKGGAVALVFGQVIVAVVFLIAALIPSGIRAAGIVKQQLRPGVIAAFQALAVAVVFGLARALALVTLGSHRARRVASVR